MSLVVSEDGQSSARFHSSHAARCKDGKISIRGVLATGTLLTSSFNLARRVCVFSYLNSAIHS